MSDALDFEKPIQELEAKLLELRRSRPDDREEIERLETRLQRLTEKTYANLTPWQRVQVARHLKRPHTLDLIQLLFDDFIELHGDRLYRDDQAIVGGLATFEGRSAVVIGHQKGRDTRENLRRNFGMAHPEGYRKALRLMKLGEKFQKPVVIFIDTPGAYPGVGAEERGQSEAIARNLREMTVLKTPVAAVVTGEGGSGGALAIGVADRIFMLEYAIYSVISPEGCAAILWGDAAKAPEAAEVLKLTAPDLLNLGVIDGIIREPLGGAHRGHEETAGEIRTVLREHLETLTRLTPETLVAQRYERFRRMGVFEEVL